MEEQDILYYIFKKGYMTFTNPTDFNMLKKDFRTKIDQYSLKDLLERLEDYDYIYTKTKRDLKGVCEDKRDIKKDKPFKISEADRCGISIEELDIGIMDVKKLKRIEEQFRYRIFFDKFLTWKNILKITIILIPLVLYYQYGFREIKDMTFMVIGTIVAELILEYIFRTKEKY